MEIMHNGVLVVRKEKDMTSFDVVSKLKKHFKTKKIGHAGTLDPMATGVLVVLINDATKLSDYLLSDKKEYEATVLLGTSTTTEDIYGEVIEENAKVVTEDEVDNVLSSLIGAQKQTPPMFSAIKINGEALYKKARKGETIEREKRDIFIYEIKRTSPLRIVEGKIYFDIKTLVSKGTYIRTLSKTIGELLNVPSCMASLNRTKSGIFDINSSYTLDEILNDKYNLISLTNATKNYYQIEVDDYLFKKVTNGMKISLKDVDSFEKTIIFKKDEKILGIYEREENYYKANRIWN